MQQACEPLRGETRRGGEKPRGRNGTFGLASESRRFWTSVHSREWTRIGPSQEGAKPTEGRWGQEAGATRLFRSDPKRGDRREPVRPAGRSSGGEPKSGSMIHQQQCWLIGDAVRNASKVRCRPAQAESAVRPGRKRGRPNHPLRNASQGEHRRAIAGSVLKPVPGELHGSGAVSAVAPCCFARL
jgi:hypothetical protein